MKFIAIILAFVLYLGANESSLVISSDIKYLKKYSDIKRNYNALNSLNVSLLGFKEGKYSWYLFLVTNPKRPHGPFWFLPHDNENSAFDSAVYAVRKYGGGFLALYNRGKRYNNGQDPNRNFSLSSQREPSCKMQNAPSPIYTSTIMSIINRYKAPNMPFLALHNNTNRGGISILKDSSSTKSFLAYPKGKIYEGKGLADEDSLVYIAGTSPNAPMSKVKALLNMGLNTKYEIVNSYNNDCSMSNFIVLNYGSNYYNIEAEHGKSATQKEMIDRLLKILGY
jgi:hypothetical protein